MCFCSVLSFTIVGVARGGGSGEYPAFCPVVQGLVLFLIFFLWGFSLRGRKKGKKEKKEKRKERNENENLDAVCIMYS